MRLPGFLHLGLAGVVLALAGSPAVAAPPVSEQMADCAGILRTVADWVTDPRDADALLALSDRWLEASTEQARVEGAYYPAFYAVSMQEEAITEWQSRRVLASFTAEFERWGAECRALAVDRGLTIYDGAS